MTTVTEARVPVLGRLARPLVAGEDRPGRGDRRRMWLAYRGLEDRVPVAAGLVWNNLQIRFDNIQAYLIDKRLEGGGGVLLRSSTASESSPTTSSPGSTNCSSGSRGSEPPSPARCSPGVSAACARGLGRSRRSRRSPSLVSGSESMETLALMLAAVGLSILIGVPLGILAGRSARFNRALTRSSTRRRSSRRTRT